MERDTIRELRLLREQMSSDFQWTSQALGHLDGRVTQLAHDWSDTTRQLQGRMRLIEERFSRFLGLVEGDVTDVREQLGDLQVRVTRLEGGTPAA